MATMKLLIFLGTAASLVLVSAMEIADDTFVPEVLVGDRDSIEDNSGDNKAIIDGIPLKYLTGEELENVLDNKDKILQCEFAIHLLKKAVENRTIAIPHESSTTLMNIRNKRFVGLLNILPRLQQILEGAIKIAQPIIDGLKIIQRFTRPGTQRDALNDFNQLRLENVKVYREHGASVQTGTLGKNRVTLRGGSNRQPPTMEIVSKNADMEYVRNISYESK